MDVSELKSIISRKLEIPISDIGREDFREYGVRFRYLGSSYRATTDLAVEKVDGGCLVTDDDARRIEKLLRTEEWDGEGLPPVGIECEVKHIADWMPVTIKFISDHHTVFTTFGGTEDCYQTYSLQFRPIRSEADKKRDEIIEAISSYALPYKCGEDIYNAIAAGKIPHIRID